VEQPRSISIAELPAPSDKLPVPPGSSGFHIKGNQYRAIVEHARDNAPGGILALLERLPPDLHGFLGQKFTCAVRAGGPGGVIALLAGVSLVACGVPAWRAARVDPASTLRADT
jgi:ABC-type lipoprotein release transport system permease subunit